MAVDDILKSEVPEALNAEQGTPEHAAAMEKRYTKEVRLLPSW